VKILLVNLGEEPFAVRRGERVAQLVVASVITAKLAVSDALSATGRGAGGFGSTTQPTRPKGTARKMNPVKSLFKKTESKAARRKAPRRRKSPHVQ
jgi:dUTP pyrophosphatase